MTRAHLRYAVAAVGLAAILAAYPAAQNDDEFARRQYDSGLAFLRSERYAEAIKDFQAVVEAFPRTRVADDALLQIALYELDIAGNLDGAQASFDRLVKEYPNSDSAPMAYVGVGRLTVARSRASADIEAALASFERVPALFPGAPAIAAARFHAGETLRLARRDGEALDRFQRVVMEFPQSSWAARADLEAAVALAASSRSADAFPALQRVRQKFPGTPEAAAALDLNTILYRLYVRHPAQPPYAFSGRYVGSETSRFRDVVGVATDAAGHILLGHRDGVAVFDAQGSLLRTVAAVEPSAFFVDGDGRVVVVRRDLLIREGAGSIAITVPAPGRPPRPADEMASVVALSNGDRVIADRRGRSVIRVRRDGAFAGSFAAVNTERLARSPMDDVAMIDRDTRSVIIADRDGAVRARIPARGTGYQLDNPVDVAFDRVGHLYVLDGNRATVHVFGPNARLLASITSPPRTAGTLQRPRALALDGAGRLYVFDEGSQRIQVYQ